MIGAAAAAEHVELAEASSQVRVARAEIGRVARVEIRRLVELGVALRGGVGAQAADPLAPRLAVASTSSKWVGWAQLIM